MSLFTLQPHPRFPLFRLYLFVLGTFTLFWWPLSHWFYPDWYHGLMGFSHYDFSLAKIIGTTGIIPVSLIMFIALRPQQNRDMVVCLLLFFPLLAVTYLYLIHYYEFPDREYINITLLAVNEVLLGLLYPWRESSS